MTLFFCVIEQTFVLVQSFLMQKMAQFTIHIFLGLMFG